MAARTLDRWRYQERVMGAYADAVETFRPAGIRCFPTSRRNPQKALRGIVPATWDEWEPSSRYADHNAAIVTGALNSIVIVDIDTRDSYTRREAEERLGESPFEVETPSGGVQRYFNFSGEERLIRQLGSAPIDILGQARNGASIAVAPPSFRPARPDKCEGRYIARGDPEALLELPPIRSGALQEWLAAKRPQSPAKGPVNGERNKALFQFALGAASSCNDREEFVESVLRHNSLFAEPLDANEVLRTADSAWKYKIEGRLYRPGGESIVAWEQSTSVAFSRCPDAFYMETVIRHANAARCARGEPFALSPKGMAESDAFAGWSHKRIRSARDWLLVNGRISRVHKGGRGKGDPDLYRFCS